MSEHNPELSNVVVWPDGEWMWEEDFDHEGGWEGCMSHKSDDYEYLAIPEEVQEDGDDAIEEFIHNHVNGGASR